MEWAIALFWLGAGADAMTTFIGVVKNGGFQEKNPIFRWLLSRSSDSTIDMVVMLGGKAALFAAFLYYYEEAAWAAFIAMGLVQLGVAVRNFKLLEKKGLFT